MSSLKNKKCQSCEKLTEALRKEVAAELMSQIPNWDLGAIGKNISRRFEFKGFNQVMLFVNALAWISQREGHHPDVSFGYNYCNVSYTTHALKGLSENDFICAAKINALLE